MYTAANIGREIVSPRKKLKIFDYEIGYMGIVMIIAAFMGFVIENAAVLAGTGVIDSRYMTLPFIGVYGFAPLAGYIMLGTPDKPHFFGKKIIKRKAVCNLIYFAAILLLITFGEIAVGTIYEKFTGNVLWDYSNLPLHITKYTSVLTTLAFGVGFFLLMKFAFSPFMRIMQKRMNYKTAVSICMTLGMLIAIDGLIMIILTFATQNAPMLWTVKIW